MAAYSSDDDTFLLRRAKLKAAQVPPKVSLSSKLLFRRVDMSSTMFRCNFTGKVTIFIMLNVSRHETISHKCAALHKRQTPKRRHII